MDGTLEDETFVEKEQLYVLPVFIKPGKHHYVVRKDPQQLVELNKKHGNRENSISSESDFHFEPEYFIHQTHVPFRTEPIPQHVKQSKSRLKVRTFKKANSVFKDWADDNEEKL